MIKLLFLCLICFKSVFAQTAIYKCIDSKDVKYWNYFNIDNDSLHFKEGNYTNVFNFKEVKFEKKFRNLIFTNGKFEFNVKHKINDNKNLIISDDRYSYNCSLETILEEPKNRTPIIFK